MPKDGVKKNYFFRSLLLVLVILNVFFLILYSTKGINKARDKGMIEERLTQTNPAEGEEGFELQDES